MSRGCSGRAGGNSEPSADHRPVRSSGPPGPRKCSLLCGAVLGALGKLSPGHPKSWEGRRSPGSPGPCARRCGQQAPLVLLSEELKSTPHRAQAEQITGMLETATNTRPAGPCGPQGCLHPCPSPKPSAALSPSPGPPQAPRLSPCLPRRQGENSTCGKQICPPPQAPSSSRAWPV